MIQIFLGICFILLHLGRKIKAIKTTYSEEELIVLLKEKTKLVFIICMTTILVRSTESFFGLFSLKNILKRLFRMFLLKYGTPFINMILPKADFTPG